MVGFKGVNMSKYKGYPTKINAQILNQETGEYHDVTFKVDGDAITIHIEGYGDYYSTDEASEPIMIDISGGKLNVILWGDVNGQDPTHVIDMEGARKEKRVEA
jgi:hypothetical protein